MAAEQPIEMTTLLPEDFRQQCEQAARQDLDPAKLASRVAQTRQRADPQLARMNRTSYAAPLWVARLLYRAGHADGRRELRAALRALGDRRRTHGVAAAAFDATRRGDWALVGWLSHQADAVLARALGSHRAEPGGEPDIEDSPDDGPADAGDATSDAADIPIRDTDPPADLCDAFIKVVRHLGRQPSRRTWGRLAHGYLAALPESYLPPVDLIVPTVRAGDAGAGRVAWMILREVLSAPSRTWGTMHNVLAELDKTRSLFARHVAGALLRQVPGTSEGDAPPEIDLARLATVFEPLLDRDDDPKTHMPPRPAAIPVARAVVVDEPTVDAQSVVVVARGGWRWDPRALGWRLLWIVAVIGAVGYLIYRSLT